MPESIVTHINDKIDMMMFELDNEDCTKRLLPSIDDYFLHFSRKVAESSMKRPVDIQLGISCGNNPFSFPIKPHHHQEKEPRIKNQIDNTSRQREYMFHQQFHERKNHFLVSSTIMTAPASTKHSPSLDKLISDVLTYVDACPEQIGDDLRKLIVKLKKSS